MTESLVVQSNLTNSYEKHLSKDRLECSLNKKSKFSLKDLLTQIQNYLSDWLCNLRIVK